MYECGRPDGAVARGDVRSSKKDAKHSALEKALAMPAVSGSGMISELEASLEPARALHNPESVSLAQHQSPVHERPQRQEQEKEEQEREQPVQPLSEGFFDMLYDVECNNVVDHEATSHVDINNAFARQFGANPVFTLVMENLEQPHDPKFMYECGRPDGAVARGDVRSSKKDAKHSALEKALAMPAVSSESVSGMNSDTGASLEPARAPHNPEFVSLARHQSPVHERPQRQEQDRVKEQEKEEQECEQPVQSLSEVFFDTIYDVECNNVVDHEVQDILTAFECAPCAFGLLQVQVIRKVKAGSAWQRDRLAEWEQGVKKMQVRAEDSSFPKPTWRTQGGRNPRELREREEVWWHLLSTSRRRPEQSKVWTARIFHGCPSMSVAESIFRSGFATNVQRTPGWFGEGVYTTTSAPYASRYALQMNDFWDCSGQTGVIVVGTVAFCEVYPVTQSDNKDPLRPLEPGLKGKRIAGAPGATGCDAHFVCVQRHPPDDDHKNFTYHACEEGTRPAGTELVVNQEAQLLPEYIVSFRVQNDEQLCRQVRVAAEAWGRSQLGSTASVSSPSSANPCSDVRPTCTPSTCNYKNDLQTRVARLLKRSVKDGDITYEETIDGHEFVSTVEVPALNVSFTGEPQPRKVAAQQSAAKAALHIAEAAASSAQAEAEAS